jgi:DNA-binding beta-propeller fold protein YncE
MRPFVLMLTTLVGLSGMAGSAAPLPSPYAPADAAEQPGQRWGDTLWIANRDAGTVTVVEAATGTVVRTMRSGDGAHDVAFAALAGKVYVTNELEDRVAVFSATTLELLRTLSMPRPHHIKVSADGRSVYVGLFNTNQIAAIDTSTDTVRIAASSNNPNARAHAPRSSNGGSLVFVPHEVGDEVTALDATTGRLIGSINPGSMPTEVLAAPDGRRLFIAMRGEGRIKVADLVTTAITGFVSVGTQPESLMLASDDRTLVSSLRGTPARLALIDTSTLTVMGTVPLAATGTFGDLAVLSPDRRYVYATFDAGVSGVGGVVVVDVLAGQRIGSWTASGPGRLHGLAYSTATITVR